MKQARTVKGELFSMPRSAATGDAIVCYPREVVSGSRSLQRLGSLAAAHGGKALIVTHRPGHMRATGAVEVAAASLSAHNISSTIFEVGPTPGVEEIDEGAKLLRAGGFDLSIGIGGGSALDASKAISLLSANSDRWESLQMAGAEISATGPVIIAVPTTAGSGSEATAVAVIANKDHGVIKSVSHPYMIPTLVVLDPDLIVSGSAQLHAIVGLDAFSHAIESFTSKRASDLTRVLSVAALQLVTNHLPRVVSGGATYIDYRNSLLGSHLAGQALSAGIGAAHILAQPISAVLGVSHGTALSLVLEEVVRFNEGLPEDPYRELIGILAGGDQGTARMSDLVGRFMSRIGIQNHPTSFGDADAIPRILSAVEQSTGHIWTNPRSVSLEALEGILTRSWNAPK